MNAARGWLSSKLRKRKKKKKGLLLEAFSDNEVEHIS